MLPMFVPRCDCCGFSGSSAPPANDCPRCGYPIDRDKEEQFLQSSVRDLQRVAAYGGANMTVSNLMLRYRRRLQFLQQVKMASVQMAQEPSQVEPPRSVAPQAPSAEIVSPSLPPVPRPAEVVLFPSQPVAPAITPTNFVPTVTPANVAPVQSSQPVPGRVFSLKSFFADQTINIVASLGAFLILVGSLSFVATSGSDLLLSFLVIFIVHAVFGVTGMVTYRFQSFRTVSVIYTAIFALLVPLVGFSGYRLVVGNHIQLSPPTLVAIAAAYAAIIYGFLAIYQKFSPFGYFAVIALAIADLAVVIAFAPNSWWWWPVALMLLAIPALVSVMSINTTPLRGVWTIWREPVSALMFTCVTACGLGIIVTFIYSLVPGGSTPEVRFSIVCMTLLLLCWACLFTWLTQRNETAFVVPYLFLASVLALSYAFEFDQSGYALALTAVALLYHGLSRFASRFVQPFDKIGLHIEKFALVLVGIVPFIFEPSVLPQLFVRAADIPGIKLPALQEPVLAAATILVGAALTISVMLHRTGLRRVPDNSQTGWRWLIPYSGFLFTWAYGIVVLALNAEPVWCFLGITLVLVAGTVALRRFVGSSWANPLDVLVLGETAMTLLLSFAQDPDHIIALLLCFTGISYGVLLFQRRPNWLFLPLVFAILALPALSARPRVTLVLGLLLPFLSVVIHRFITDKVGVVHADASTQQRQRQVTIWEWPLLAIGLLCGIMVLGRDTFMPESVVHSWLPGWFHIPFPVALEMATFSLVWYAAAALARVKWWLFAAVGFAIVALLFDNPFWVLAWLAPILAVLAFGVSRLVSRNWATPLYIVALFAAIMMGITAYTQEQTSTATWTLLLFATLIYLIGVAEKQPVLVWTAPFFATWSVYYSGQLGDLYRPPIVALVCAALGVAIGCLRFFVPPFSSTPQVNRFLRCALPVYTTALASALLTGIYGTLAGVNHPFFTAVPDALLVYALVAYGVLLFERRPQGLALVAFFAVWATLLALQTTAYYVLGVGLTAGLVGLLLSRLVTLQRSTGSSASPGSPFFKFTWGWPWYLTTLVAAIILGMGFSADRSVIEYGLLAFAVLAYVIGVVEDMLAWSWIGVVLAVWSLLDAAGRDDPYRLFTVALVCSSAGLVMMILRRLLPALAQRRKHLEYVLPFYVTALAAAVLTGLPATFGGNVNHPFITAIPDALLVYALVAYGVSLIEQRVRWLWLVAGFTLWGVLLIPQTVSCLSETALCRAQIQTAVGFLTGVTLVSGIAGLLAGRFIKRGTDRIIEGAETRPLFTWSWPWYLTSLFTMMTTINCSSNVLLPHSIELSILCSFIVLTLGIMLLERAPEMLVVPVALAAWTIARIPWDFWQLMVMYNLLCVLIFASQFVWKVLSPATRVLPAARLHQMLALGGQILVVLIILFQGGFFAGAGSLAHVGAGSLLILALLIFWFGYLHSDKAARRWCGYVMGLLLSLAVAWELSAQGQTRIDILLLAPASYLVVVAPFLSRDETLPQHRRHLAGRICSVLGAVCLLLPTLWLSFSQDNFQPTLILAGEALALLLLGIGTRIRFFALSGASFVIISAIHALFLPSLGISPYLALAILGGVLLAIATALKLIGRRLQIVLAQWE